MILPKEVDAFYLHIQTETVPTDGIGAITGCDSAAAFVVPGMVLSVVNGKDRSPGRMCALCAGPSGVGVVFGAQRRSALRLSDQGREWHFITKIRVELVFCVE